MSSQVLPVLLGLGAAASFAYSGAAKHLSADDGPDDAQVGSVLRHTLRHPLWQLGIAADVLGLALQIIALHLGGLVLVQPLLTCAVAGSLLLRRRLAHLPSDRAELAWSGVLVAALAVFVVIMSIGHGASSSSVDSGPGYLLAIVGAVAVAVVVGAAYVRRGGRVTAGSLGAAVGLLYAAAAALLTLLSAQVLHGGIGLALRRDEIYAVVVIGVLTQVINQAAFRSGALAASAPAAASTDLLASVVLGVAVFDQPLPGSAVDRVFLVVALAVVVLAVVVLARREGDPPTV